MDLVWKYLGGKEIKDTNEINESNEVKDNQNNQDSQDNQEFYLDVSEKTNIMGFIQTNG